MREKLIFWSKWNDIAYHNGNQCAD